MKLHRLLAAAAAALLLTLAAQRLLRFRVRASGPRGLGRR